MRNHKIRAFTLIELMVVILILAILAALIVPKVIGRQDEAKRGKAISDVRTLENALNQFRLHCDRYPTSEEGLQALRTQPSDVNGWRGPYLDKPIPLDPWQNEYVYEDLGDDKISVMSYGADGAPGGDGNGEDVGGLEEEQ